MEKIMIFSYWTSSFRIVTPITKTGKSEGKTQIKFIEKKKKRREKHRTKYDNKPAEEEITAVVSCGGMHDFDCRGLHNFLYDHDELYFYRGGSCYKRYHAHKKQPLS